MFWFNVPFGLAGSLWACLVLHEVTGPLRGHGRSTPPARSRSCSGLTGLVLGICKGGICGWNSPAVIGSLIAAAVLLPLFVLIERHQQVADARPARSSRTGCSRRAAAAAFLNGLARFALMFVFVFYFQGVQGNSPILAGLKLAPLAVGMLIASPLAGIWADRRGSRTLASLGMLVTALGLALMTTLGRDTSYWAPASTCSSSASARACSTRPTRPR